MNGIHSTHPSSNRIELIRFGHHYRTLKKNWLSILAFTIIFSLTCTWYIYSKKSVYQATATLLIQEEQKVHSQLKKCTAWTPLKKSTFKLKSPFLNQITLPTK